MKSPVAVIQAVEIKLPRLAGDENWQPLSLDEARKVNIQKVLQMCNSNRLRAAQILGIGRASLYRYLKRDSQDTSPMVLQLNLLPELCRKFFDSLLIGLLKRFDPAFVKESGQQGPLLRRTVFVS